MNNKTRKFKTTYTIITEIPQEELDIYSKDDLTNFYSIIDLYLNINSFELKSKLSKLINDDIKDEIINKYQLGDLIHAKN